MSSEIPPTVYFNGITFNPDFYQSTSSDYLTASTGKSYFLSYPKAQGTETISTLKTSSIDTATPTTAMTLFGSQTANLTMATAVTGTIRLGAYTTTSTHIGNIDHQNNNINNASAPTTGSLGLGTSQTDGILNIGTGSRTTTGAINIGTGATAGIVNPITIGSSSSNIYLYGTVSVMNSNLLAYGSIACASYLSASSGGTGSCIFGSNVNSGFVSLANSLTTGTLELANYNQFAGTVTIAGSATSSYTNNIKLGNLYTTTTVNGTLVCNTLNGATTNATQNIGNNIDIGSVVVGGGLTSGSMTLGGSQTTGILNIGTAVRTGTGAINIGTNTSVSNNANINIGGNNTNATTGAVSRSTVNINGANLWSNTETSTSLRSNGTISLSSYGGSDINIGAESGYYNNVNIGVFGTGTNTRKTNILTQSTTIGTDSAFTRTVLGNGTSNSTGDYSGACVIQKLQVGNTVSTLGAGLGIGTPFRCLILGTAGSGSSSGSVTITGAPSTGSNPLVFGQMSVANAGFVYAVQISVSGLSTFTYTKTATSGSSVTGATEAFNYIAIWL